MPYLYFELSDNWRRLKQSIITTIVWALPRWVIYWAVVRAYAHATTGKYGDTSPDTLGYGELMRRWDAA